MKKEILTLDDYQVEARRSAIYPHQGENLIYTVMGLCGEAGELANKVKKLMRSYGLQSGTPLASLRNPKAMKKLMELEGELGGILWYVAMTARELGLSLNHIGIANIDELSERVKKGNVEGDGDDRGRR